MTTLLRTWNAELGLEEWVHPQDGVFWGHCEEHSDCCADDENCDDLDWVAFVGRFNLCATCERVLVGDGRLPRRGLT